VAAHMRNRGTGTAIWALRAAVSARPMKARLMCFDTAEAYGETARSDPRSDSSKCHSARAHA